MCNLYNLNNLLEIKTIVQCVPKGPFSKCGLLESFCTYNGYVGKEPPPTLLSCVID